MWKNSLKLLCSGVLLYNHFFNIVSRGTIITQYQNKELLLWTINNICKAKLSVSYVKRHKWLFIICQHMANTAIYNKLRLVEYDLVILSQGYRKCYLSCCWVGTGVYFLLFTLGRQKLVNRCSFGGYHWCSHLWNRFFITMWGEGAFDVNPCTYCRRENVWRFF